MLTLNLNVVFSFSDSYDPEEFPFLSLWIIHLLCQLVSPTWYELCLILHNRSFFSWFIEMVLLLSFVHAVKEWQSWVCDFSTSGKYCRDRIGVKDWEEIIVYIVVTTTITNFPSRISPAKQYLYQLVPVSFVACQFFFLWSQTVTKGGKVQVR